MKLRQPTAEIFVPDGQPVADALRRITHLGIGAHPDDLEFIAFHGILAGYPCAGNWFGGVTCTHGSGSARSGPYAGVTDEEMIATRRREQNAAAVVGRYGLMIQLDYPSRTVQCPGARELVEDLKQILVNTQPRIVYTHNPADKHETHIGVVVAALQAMRELPRAQRPPRVWGCELWRDLDWLPDADKVRMEVGGHEDLAEALSGAFVSQITGGKRYDLATLGRWRANATFLESHATDTTTMQIFGIDLTPLVADESRDIVEYVTGFIDKFKADVTQKLGKRLGC